MSSEKKPQPVAWRYSLLMRDSMGGWERKIEPTDPRTLSYIRQERLRDVDPLYSEAAIEALRAERDEARKEAGELVVAQYAISALEARVAQLEAALEPFAAFIKQYDEGTIAVVRSQHPGEEISDPEILQMAAPDDQVRVTTGEMQFGRTGPRVTPLAITNGNLRRARALLSDGGADV